MSTSRRSACSGPSKKISSWVRPGVLEVRASALRPVSALMRLDLPTLERPANAISGAAIGGSEASELAAETKFHSPANSNRPASTSALEKSPAEPPTRCSPATVMASAVRTVPAPGNGGVARAFYGVKPHGWPPFTTLRRKSKKGTHGPLSRPSKVGVSGRSGGRLAKEIAIFGRLRHADRIFVVALVARGCGDG